MKRGRPSDDYPRAEFVETALHRMKALGISQTALADHSQVHRAGRSLQVDRGTVSRIIRGQRPASHDVRLALMRTLEFEPELVARFEGPSRSVGQVSEPKLISDYNFPRRPLVKAVSLLVRGFYPDAARELKRIFGASADNGDAVLQADAAARMAWLHLEIGDFLNSERWAQRSITTSATFIGASMPEILRCVSRFPSEGSSSKPLTASRILSDALHLRSQILASKMLYVKDEGLNGAVQAGLERSLALDRRLDLPELIGNDLRWKAIMEVTGNQPNLISATKLIDESKDKFVRGGLYEAHWINARGVIQLQAGSLAQAKRLLTDAGEKLSSFTDAPGLALTNYLLSDVVLRTSGNRREALRHIIAAAALHPYGFLIERCSQQACYSNRRDVQSEIDYLLAGRHDYQIVHQMMARLAHDSPHSPVDLLQRNIDLMLANGFPRVTVPSRRIL